MRLARGADVYSASGDRLGTLSRVIIDPNTRQVTHLVVEKGLLFTDNKLIPISRVNLENDEKITLLPSDQEQEEFENFEESHFVDLDQEDVPPNAEAAPSIWYPPTEYAWWRSGMQMAYPPMPPYTIRTTQNIPDGTIALEEGAGVVSVDNKQVGHISQLFVDPQDNRVTHFVVSEGVLFKERKLIPVTWISMIGEHEVRLSVNARTLEGLPAYHKPG